MCFSSDPPGRASFPPTNSPFPSQATRQNATVNTLYNYLRYAQLTRQKATAHARYGDLTPSQARVDEVDKRVGQVAEQQFLLKK